MSLGGKPLRKVSKLSRSPFEFKSWEWVGVSTLFLNVIRIALTPTSAPLGEGPPMFLAMSLRFPSYFNSWEGVGVNINPFQEIKDMGLRYLSSSLDLIS